MDRFLLFLFLVTIMTLSLQAQDNIWNRHVIDSTLSGADGVRLADVNNDNLMDITTGWEEGGYTKVYVHPGYNLAKQKWPAVIVGKTPDVEDAVFVDIDDDGRMDVVSSTEGKNRKIYFNWAPTDPLNYLDSSKWNTQTLPASDGLMQWMFAFPAQIDGKNGIDLVVGSKNKDAKIGWFQAPRNSRNLSDWKWYPIGSATWIMSIIIRDMDNDGDLDIVTSDRKPGATKGVRWLENPGKIENQKKEWDNHFIGCQGLEVMFMDMADMDGDGLEDAIVTEYTHQKIVYMKRLNKNGLEWNSYNIDIPNITGRAKAVKVGDIDGDGNPDIVHSTNTLNDPNKSGIYWLSYRDNPNDPIWDWHELSGPKGIKFDRIELLDLDGDGDLDVLTCEENYGTNSEGLGVIWYENPFIKATNYR
ncbi:MULTISPECIES: FG-GAP repeat domain-containing protein [Arenibacter]|uniref:FG-GAP repeat domain-containing protein n=1 Tax=Arenibacter TaxID=178469 RepID=UPI0004DFA894|nr:MULTISPECIES: VCBS repeat-containing protein [Arenibacter]